MIIKSGLKLEDILIIVLLLLFSSIIENTPPRKLIEKIDIGMKTELGKTMRTLNPL